MDIDIYFDDLKEHKQDEIKEEFGVEPEDMNWDTIPIHTIYDEYMD